VAEKEVDKIQEQYNYGLIMDDEREQKIVNAWTKAANDVVDAILKNLDKFNPYILWLIPELEEVSDRLVN